MRESEAESAMVKERPKGVQALFGAAVAIIGVLAAANPTSAILEVLGEAVPSWPLGCRQ